MIECKNLRYTYKGTDKGIKDINLKIEKGNMIAIVGRNGAGKSTLLNIIMGLKNAQSGSIICDTDLTYHDVGFCTQKQSIDWYLSVKDNILLGGLLSGMNQTDAKNKTNEIMELMDLSEYSKNLPDGLSGGQQQRLQVARALIHSPEFLILDEPTAGMDYIYSKRLFEYLKNEVGKGGTVLVSSHDLALLEDYCNKLLFLDTGKQIYYGNMMDFLNNNKVDNMVNIIYSGEFTEESVNKIKSLNCTIEDSQVSMTEGNISSLGEVIQLMNEDVKIEGISIEKNGLKNYM